MTRCNEAPVAIQHNEVRVAIVVEVASNHIDWREASNRQTYSRLESAVSFAKQDSVIRGPRVGSNHIQFPVFIEVRDICGDGARTHCEVARRQEGAIAAA